MSGTSNKITRFWQELKRRRVIRVTTMYAATAFILMEAADIMFPRLGLPDWTVTFLIVLLIAGLPVAIILSWIFDITPEGVQKTTPLQEQPAAEVTTEPKKRRFRASDTFIVVLLIVVAVLVYPKIFKPDRIEYFRKQGEISLAVMPFRNLTGDPEHNYWQVMVQDNLISTLSGAGELTVRQMQSTTNVLQSTDPQNYASISPAMARNISKKLDAEVFIQGSISRAGNRIRINANLTDAETEEVLKPFAVEGKSGEIITLTDSLSVQVRDFLVISILKKELNPEARKYMGTISSTDAARAYIEGISAFYARDYRTAILHFEQATASDPDFLSPRLYLALSYSFTGNNEKARELCQRAYGSYRNGEEYDVYTGIMVEWLYATFFGTPRDQIRILRQALDMDEQQPFIHYMIGNAYVLLEEFERAVPELERSLELYEQWDIRPAWVFNYVDLAEAYYETGRIDEERKLLKKAEKDFPDDPLVLQGKLVLALNQGKLKRSDALLEEYMQYLHQRSSEDAYVDNVLGGVYSNAGLTDRAEQYYLRAVEERPAGSQGAVYLNNAAYFLIENNRQQETALELAREALALDPDNYLYLDTRGWGLYKAGMTGEALELLKKSWELKPVYNHEIFLHLREVKKAAGESANGSSPS